MIHDEDIRRNFKSYRLGKRSLADCMVIRRKFGELGLLINGIVPDGREKSLVLTKLEEAMFWANAGISRSGVEVVEG